MKINIYSIKDTKVGAFKSPFYAQNNMVAMRSLKNAVNDKNGGELYLNAEDFQLFNLGEFDDITGQITNNVEFICNAIDLKVKE